MKLYVLILIIFLCNESVVSADDVTNELLSEKELKLIRFVSYLTYFQTTSMNMTWNGWEKNFDGPQLDLGSIRYPLAHIGYTAATLAYRTPNYRELSLNILNDVIQRMLTIKVWGYIDQYWSKYPTFPDPVYHENIMYSGHLLQLIGLYESLSGDFTYDTQGFDFVWNKTSGNTTKFHYSTSKLAEVIYRQMADESSAGVPCEPGWVYTICQNHPHLGFRLYDINRNDQTNYSTISSKWRHFLIDHALEDVPLYKKDRYFKMLYNKATHVWVPLFAATGNDGWVLAWLSSWFDQNQTSKFVCDGWKIMHDNTYWKPSANQSAPGCFLDSGGYIGVRMQMNSWLATSFYPIIEKQCSIEATEKLNCTYQWFENNFARLLDTDHDGVFESFYYETNNIFANWVTTNVLLSFVMGQNGENTQQFLRNVYQTKFYAKFIDQQPEVLQVQYPLVRVTRARFDPNTKGLIVNFNTEKPMIFSTNFQIKYPNSVLSVSNITRDGLLDGFTIKQISVDRIEIQYQFNDINQQQTEFNILFH